MRKYHIVYLLDGEQKEQRIAATDEDDAIHAVREIEEACNCDFQIISIK